jgi:hypothetical protein
MSISSSIRKAGPYSGNGSTTQFPFSFKVFSASDILVVRTDPSGVESNLVLGTDYTVALNADQDANQGGTITAITAPATGYLITITSQVQNLQPVTLTNQGAFYPKVINDALDRATIQIQQVAEQVGRAVKVPISSAISPDDFIRQLETAAANAAASAASAAAKLAEFNGVYYGPYASNPAVDPNGAAPGAGDTYYNTATKLLMVFDGTTWWSVSARTPYSVTDFGADPTGVKDSTAAFSAIAPYPYAVIPSGTYLLNTTPTLGNGVVVAQGNVTLTGAGAVSFPLNSPSKGEQTARISASSSDISDFAVRRNANYVGGTPGFVNSALRVDTYVAAQATNFEWGITSTLHNTATAGENVAIYGQGLKSSGAGPTWAGVFEARDTSGNANSTTGLIGLEVDVFANGTDTHNARIGADIVCGIGVGATDAPTIYAGIRVGPQNGVSTNATFFNGLLFDNTAIASAGINFSNVNGPVGIAFSGELQIGIDLSTVNTSVAAIKVGGGKKLAFDDLSTVYLSESSGSLTLTGGRLILQNGLGIFSAGNISTTATAGSATLPTKPAGFMMIAIDGSTYKIPYYGN